MDDVQEKINDLCKQGVVGYFINLKRTKYKAKTSYFLCYRHTDGKNYCKKVSKKKWDSVHEAKQRYEVLRRLEGYKQYLELIKE